MKLVNSSITSSVLSCLLALSITAAIPLVANAAGGSLSPQALTALVNEERSDAGLATLSTSALLTKAAQAKANDMAKQGYFAHTSPDGQSFSHWFSSVGYSYKSAGENLAQGFSTSDATVAGWMQSPGHRANILASKYTETGIATARGTYQGKEVTFVVQMFGTPSGTNVAMAKPTAAPTAPKAPTLKLPTVKLVTASAKEIEPTVEIERGSREVEVIEISSTTPDMAPVLDEPEAVSVRVEEKPSLLARLMSLLQAVGGMVQSLLA